MKQVRVFRTPIRGCQAAQATSGETNAKNKEAMTGRRTGEGDCMYRSVTESQQQGSEKRRLWRWAEGVLVGLVVLVGVTYLFGLLTF